MSNALYRVDTEWKEHAVTETRSSEQSPVLVERIRRYTTTTAGGALLGALAGPIGALVGAAAGAFIAALIERKHPD